MNTKKRQVLGRGLSSLIPVENNDNVKGEADIVNINISLIQTNPFQPRLDFDEDEIKGLSESIKNQGLLQPIVVRKNENFYQIISGERRFRALKLLGNDSVPCIIKHNVTDREMLELALVENIQREDLNEIETAISYEKLLFDCNMSHQELSEKIGKSRSVITNTLRLLKLPSHIQSLLRNRKISMGHARALLSVDNEENQTALANRIVNENITVREIETLSSKKAPVKKEKVSVEKIEQDPDTKLQEENLKYLFGTDVKIFINKTQTGYIEIPFFSLEDMNRVIDVINEKK